MQKNTSSFFQSFMCPHPHRGMTAHRPCRAHLVLEDPFATGRRLPQNTLPSHPKPRQTHKCKPTAQCLPSSQIGVHMHTCPRTSLFFHLRKHNSLKCSVSRFLSGLGFTKMATGMGPGDENLLSYTQRSPRSVLLTFVS